MERGDYGDIRSCSQERLRWLYEGKPKYPFKDIAVTVANSIEALYEKASIPVISHKGVVKRILEFHNKYENLLKSFNKTKGTLKCSAETVASFKTKGKALFDVAACQCEPIESCTCEKARKVPQIEHAFLTDQRKHRLMVIGKVDADVTRVLQKRLDRKLASKSRSSEASDARAVTSSSILAPTSDPQNDSDSGEKAKDTEDEFVPSKSVTKQFLPKTQKRIKLTNTAAISDRFGTSVRETAAISSAILLDYGIVTPENQSCVIDKSKVAREKANLRRQTTENAEKQTTELRGLYFDGRKDKTLFQVKEGSKYYRKLLTEEHVSLVGEPGSQFVGHVSPSSGSAVAIVESIVDNLEQKKISTEKLEVVGCDGTATNTGYRGGVIRLLELKLNKALQWSICMLHFIELPLRHLMQDIDGPTSGPTSYSGPIEKQLTECKTLPVTNFRPIAVDLPVMNPKDLSKDQQYLYEICQAVSSGDCPTDLSNRDPGPISHARWITTANRLLRLYVGTKKPSAGLRIIVLFLQKVYSPMWFAIKTRYSCVDGSRLLWECVDKTRVLPKKYEAVVHRAISQNAFYAHPENILIGMLGDEQREVRATAVSRILHARQNAPKTPDPPRTFKVPSINFQAKKYYDLIDWEKENITEPPVLRRLSDEQICSFVDDPSQVSLFDAFPCHTQAVERMVKEVTRASLNVCGAENRDGFIRNALLSRQVMPSFHTKNQFRGLQLHANDNESTT